MAKYDYKGVIHLHSTYSDGFGSVEEIMQCANDTGLDFVMLTDHDTLKPAEDGHEKWHGSSLLVVGTEITPQNNHYIVFGEKALKGIEKLPKRSPQEIIDDVDRQGWIGFIAHPDHKGSERFDIPPYEWKEWSVDRFTGMGIWDLMTDWQNQLQRENLTMDVYTDFANWLTGPLEATLKRWDELNQKRKVVGIGEIDNHKITREYEGQKLVIFPYELAFKTVTNHVLLDKTLDKDPKKAKKQLIEALKKGSCYVSFDYWDDPTEFNFEIEEGDQCAGMGEELTLKEKAEVIVSLPSEAHINIMCNGKSVWEGDGDETIIEIAEKGVYRVEAMRNDLTWVLSNPIFVK